MTTIVSGFFYEKKSNCKTFDDYYTYGKSLLELDIPKIIFLDELMYDHVINNSVINDSTYLVCIKKEEFYLFNMINSIENFGIRENSQKNTLTYCVIICLKPEIMNKAITLNIFGTDQFLWIDFGIKHVCKNLSDSEFTGYIHNMCMEKYHNVRIAGIWDIQNVYPELDIFINIHWYFAGGVFGGDKMSLLKFGNLMKEKCIDIVTRYKTITWEVNVWYLLYKENPELFDIYKCDHNSSILTNYNKLKE